MSVKTEVIFEVTDPDGDSFKVSTDIDADFAERGVILSVEAYDTVHLTRDDAVALAEFLLAEAGEEA